MKQKSTLFDADALLPYVCAAFVIFLIFTPTISNILLIAFTSIWLVSGEFKQKFKIIKTDKLLLAFVALYLLHIIGSLYTQDLHDAEQVLSIRLPLLLLTVLIGTASKPINKTGMRTVMTTYVVSVAACSLYLLIIASVHAYNINDNFINYLITASDPEIVELSKLKNHRPYLGLLVAFAVLILTFNDSTFLNSQCLRLTVAFLLLLSLFFLFKAKMSALAAILALFIRYFPKHTYLKVFIVVFTSLIAIIWYKSISIFVYNKVILSDGGSRLRNWQTSFNAIRDSPLLGHGSGDEIYTLQNFRAEGSWEYIHAYNSHNQYLSTTIQLGIVGLLILLLIMYHLFQRSYKYYKPGMYLVFLFALAGLSEVLLSRNVGVLFIGFFSGLIISHCRFLSQNNIHNNARYS